MFKKRWVGMVAAAVLLGAGASRGAVVFSEDFESASADNVVPTGWTSNNAPTDSIYKKATPGLVGGNLPDGNASAKSFVQGDALLSRISRAFTPNAAATSFKLSWYQYLNDVSTGTQRSIGQLSTGTAAAPGASANGFFRLGTVNVSNWGYIFANGATQTVQTPTPIATGSPGWHKLQMTVFPGVAGAGSVVFQVDSNAPITLNTASSPGLAAANATTIPNVVTLGNNVANGGAGAPDTSQYFDSVLLEQFAPASALATNPGPADLSTAIDPDQDLSWTGGSNTTDFKVYLGTTPTPTTLVATQAGTTFDPGTLLDNTTYYWRVDARNVLGDATPGTVWSFTTGSVPEPASMGILMLSAAACLVRGRRSR